jgi:hypothetical protein
MTTTVGARVLFGTAQVSVITGGVLLSDGAGRNDGRPVPARFARHAAAEPTS